MHKTISVKIRKKETKINFIFAFFDTFLVIFIIFILKLFCICRASNNDTSMRKKNSRLLFEIVFGEKLLELLICEKGNAEMVPQQDSEGCTAPARTVWRAQLSK